MIHPMGVSGDPVKGVPFVEVIVKGSQFDLLPGGSKTSGELLRVYDLRRSILRRGDSVGKGPNAFFIAHHPVQDTRVISTAGRNDDLSIYGGLPPPHGVPEPLPYFILGERCFVQSFDRGVLHPLHPQRSVVETDQPRGMGQNMYVSDGGVPEDAITEVHVISQALVVNLQIGAIDHIVDEWPRLPRTSIVKIWGGSHPIGFEQYRHTVPDTPFAVDGIISSTQAEDLRVRTSSSTPHRIPKAVFIICRWLSQA